LAAWEIQAYRTLGNDPDAADLVRVARVHALINTITVVVGGAAARRGEIDAGVIDRLTPALENAQLAWSRSARRWEIAAYHPGNAVRGSRRAGAHTEFVLPAAMSLSASISRALKP
jgi:hypothetical protein